MSVGAWALLVFGFFVFVSFVDAWLSRGGPFIPLFINRVFNVLGSLVGLFVASYTGVLLSVSNQPVWSDTWALGGLFLASGLSGAAALYAAGRFAISYTRQEQVWFLGLQEAQVFSLVVLIASGAALIWLYRHGQPATAQAAST